jgi:hypothetical protein
LIAFQHSWDAHESGRGAFWFGLQGHCQIALQISGLIAEQMFGVCMNSAFMAMEMGLEYWVECYSSDARSQTTDAPVASCGYC